MRMISRWTVTVEYTTTPRGVPEVVGEGPATATPVAEAHKFLIPRPAREHFLKSFGTSVFQTHHVDELLRHLEIAESTAFWRDGENPTYSPAQPSLSASPVPFASAQSP